jgi:hypothetical protein
MRGPRVARRGVEGVRVVEEKRPREADQREDGAAGRVEQSVQPDV